MDPDHYSQYLVFLISRSRILMALHTLLIFCFLSLNYWLSICICVLVVLEYQLLKFAILRFWWQFLYGDGYFLFWTHSLLLLIAHYWLINSTTNLILVHNHKSKKISASSHLTQELQLELLISFSCIFYRQCPHIDVWQFHWDHYLLSTFPNVKTGSSDDKYPLLMITFQNMILILKWSFRKKEKNAS